MKILFTSFLLFVSLILFGQMDYELTPIPSHAEGAADMEDFTAHATIKNLSDQTIVVAWQRINNDIPTGWQSYLCSNITCAPPDIAMGTFSLTAYDSTNLDCHFVPEGIPGNGMVEFRLFLTADTTQVIFATYLGDANPVSTSQAALQDQIKVYPNPTNNYLTIESIAYRRIELFDNHGILIRSFGISPTLNLNILPSGNYFLRFYDESEKLVSINTFQKILAE